MEMELCLRESDFLLSFCYLLLLRYQNIGTVRLEPSLAILAKLGSNIRLIESPHRLSMHWSPNVANIVAKCSQCYWTLATLATMAKIAKLASMLLERQLWPKYGYMLCMLLSIFRTICLQSECEVRYF